MGMPEIVINFREQQSNFMHRLGRGTVCYVVLDEGAKAAETYEIVYKNKIDQTLSAATGKEALIAKVKRMFEYGANKVIVAIGANLEALSKYLEAARFNYLAVDGAPADVVAWAETKGFRCGRRFLLVTDGASIELKSDDNKHNIVSVYPEHTGITYGWPSDIAAIIAGSSNRSATYQTVMGNESIEKEELSLYPAAKSDVADAKIDAGFLTLVNDGEKVKIGRAVTMYYQKKPGSPSIDTSMKAFSKVRAVDILNMIEDDIRDNFENQYIGQVPNGYANKMNFISLINAVYLPGLVGTALDGEGVNEIDIDLEKTAEVAAANGDDASLMSEEQLRKYNTGDKLYLAGSLRILDTMEDLQINFTVNG